WIGLPEPRPGFRPEDARTLALDLSTYVGGLEAKDRAFHLPSGHAAGLAAMASALEEIRRKRADLAVVGGVDSYLHPATLQWLDDNRRLQADADSRSSFIPGEG